MTSPFRWPPSLGPGARVALVSPAGPLRGPADVERAEASARRLGWEPVLAPHALQRAGYLAGSDAERLADLDGAIRDPTIDGIWCLRGGYGTMRLLDALDVGALRRRPKALVGFSDITALHAAVGRGSGLVSYHGPVARHLLAGRGERSLRAAVVERCCGCGAAPGARALRPGRAAGRLAGGNLALLASLCGTRWMPELDGAILVIEDVHEAVYRVDRMLRQLLLAGVLAGVRALVAGQFTDVPAEPDGEARPLDEVLYEVAEALDVPCLAGVPVGHVDEQWTIPLGARAEVDVDGARLDVTPASVAASRRRHGRGTPPHHTHWRSTMAQKSGTDLINDAKSRITEVTPQAVRERLERGDAVVYLDVREPNEWNLGHIPGAVHIPRGTLETKVEAMIPRDQDVVVYCAGGNRSALAADTLQQMGYDKVSSMSDGWRGWVQTGGPVEG
ncbi:MAG TPA: LD-carboxypeptidase [Gemmatimonadaceae bacterium]|nr:LD-carboxypeptidase [Gemmatimonadaceae bacterium]